MNLVSAGLMMALVLSACRTEGPPAASRATPSPSSTPTPTTGGAGGCSQDANVTVLGRANIFGAGIDELPAPGGGGGGVPPPCVAIPDGASMATVPRADGQVPDMRCSTNVSGHDVSVDVRSAAFAPQTPRELASPVAGIERFRHEVERQKAD